MDTSTLITIAFFIAVFIFLFYESYAAKKRKLEKLKKTIREQWGKEAQGDIEEPERIEYYFNRSVNEDTEYIDDITWNDVDMDNVFARINSTYSSMGEEYLYKMLRMPEYDEGNLKERDRIIQIFQKDKEKAFRLSEIFSAVGRTKKISLLDFVDRLDNVEVKSNAMHYVLIALMLISIVTLFIEPVFGIMGVVVMLCVNVGTYYSKKAEVENYFVCMRYIVGMQNAAYMISKCGIDDIDKYVNRLKEINKTLAPVRKGIFWLAPKNIDGSVSEVVLEYVRMITHADIIKFNNMLKHTNTYRNEIIEMFEILGMLDACVAVASYRESLEYYVTPEFAGGDNCIKAVDVYHPMVSNPVANTIDEKKCVLLTGSNASGKSTFLKTIAINAIFAQTIYTCLAHEYVTPFYDIYSSMALKDNLLGNESYYIVEIKSLKRIIDKVKNGRNVLCFVDEVLRGTNTVERIAASSMILKELSDMGAMCFAATHDIELTNILAKYYSNYHFQEEVSNDDVLFNYTLYKGQATSRNAIRLLNVMGYDKDITNRAEEAANLFINTGKWKNIE